VGHSLRLLLHRRPLLYARVHHAEIPTTIVAQERLEEQGKTVSIYGADVHCLILWMYGSLGLIRHEPDPPVVFQHQGHVRTVPAQDT
jgi:hypothetical protein